VSRVTFKIRGKLVGCVNGATGLTWKLQWKHGELQTERRSTAGCESLIHMKENGRI